MRIVTLLHQVYNGVDEVWGVCEDINDAIKAMEEFEKKYPRQHKYDERFYLEDMDVIPKGGNPVE